MIRKIFPALFILFLALPARAEVENYTLDKPHTQIIFVANHLGFSRSFGKFTDYSGSFVFDRGSPENSRVEVAIKTDSLDLADAKWNEHMKSADYFNVAQFPEMTFKSTAIKILSETTADITGDLTLLGVTKPVVLHTTYNKSDKFPFGDRYVSGFSAQARLKRSDFGMTHALPMIADDIDVIIEVEGIRVDQPGQESRNQ